MAPQNVAFHWKLYESINGGPFTMQYEGDDNGAGGGDCSTSLPNVYFYWDQIGNNRVRIEATTSTGATASATTGIISVTK